MNFQKMLAEKKAADKEREMRMKQLMDMQKNMSEQADENANKQGN